MTNPASPRVKRRRPRDAHVGAGRDVQVPDDAWPLPFYPSLVVGDIVAVRDRHGHIVQHTVFVTKGCELARAILLRADPSAEVQPLLTTVATWRKAIAPLYRADAISHSTSARERGNRSLYLATMALDLDAARADMARRALYSSPTAVSPSVDEPRPTPVSSFRLGPFAPGSQGTRSLDSVVEQNNDTFNAKRLRTIVKHIGAASNAARRGYQGFRLTAAVTPHPYAIAAGTIGGAALGYGEALLYSTSIEAIGPSSPSDQLALPPGEEP